DISQLTRVRAGLVRAIEADDFSGCGGAVYARGHIKTIARTVGVDPEPLVAQFDRQYGAPAVSPTAVIETLEPDSFALRDLRKRRGPNWPAAMGAALVVVIIIAAIGLVGQSHRGGPSGAARGAALPLAPSPASTITAAAAPKGAVAFAGVTVDVSVIGQPSWVHVVDESGNVLFVGVLPPGSVRDFHAARLLAFIIGNAGAVDLIVNGHDLGLAGSSGQVVRPVFNPSSSALG
ncbi:MAG: helix-turn-helix domain-containing protein, partial [Mycobacteriales bacterium]